MRRTGKKAQRLLNGRLIRTLPSHMAPPASTVLLQMPLPQGGLADVSWKVPQPFREVTPRSSKAQSEHMISMSRVLQDDRSRSTRAGCTSHGPIQALFKAACSIDEV